GTGRGDGVGAGRRHGPRGGLLPRRARLRDADAGRAVERGGRERADDRPEQPGGHVPARGRRRGDQLPDRGWHRGRGGAAEGRGRGVHRWGQQLRLGERRPVQGHRGQRPAAVQPAAGL
ncbi:MAG: hypothetical protein AVDCRST_MAG35-2724, partial [uncultured Quadrisphaera sp.]